MYQNTEQREFARSLRKNMTDAELRLWNALRGKQLKGFKFRRQAAIGFTSSTLFVFPPE